MNQSCPRPSGLASIYINATADQWQKVYSCLEYKIAYHKRIPVALIRFCKHNLQKYSAFKPIIWK